MRQGACQAKIGNLDSAQMATTTKKDYYEILGVKKSASTEDIRKAFRSLRANIIRTSIPETKLPKKNLRPSPKPTMFSAIPRSARFTTNSGSTPTILIRRRLRLMRVEVQPVPADLVVFPAGSPEPVVRARTSISADLISPICSKELGAGELVEAPEVSAISSPEFSADAAAPPRRKAPSRAQISNTR